MTSNTSNRFPAPPAPTDLLSVTDDNPAVREFLAKRRSPSKRTITAPGPSENELTELLQVAARVPDHRKLGPWRFIVFDGEARATFGETIADIFKTKNPNATEKQLTEERERFLRAPTVVAVISSPKDDGRTPIWEQELSAGALCYNFLLAARACGWASVWLTEWIAFDEDIADALHLTDTERVAGIMYIGSSSIDAPVRPRPDIADRTLRWKA